MQWCPSLWSDLSIGAILIPTLWDVVQGRHFSSGWTQSNRFNLADHKMFVFVQIPKIRPDLKLQITNIGQQGGQLVQFSDVLCLILNQNILHLVKLTSIDSGPETKKRKWYEYIRANFFGLVPISNVYFIFRRRKKKLKHILIMFWKIVALELSRQMSSGKLLT